MKKLIIAIIFLLVGTSFAYARDTIHMQNNLEKQLNSKLQLLKVQGLVVD